MDSAEKFRLFQSLRRKNKDGTITDEEKLFLYYHKIVFLVSEVCVDVSKHNRSAEHGINDIRNYLNEWV